MRLQVAAKVVGRLRGEEFPHFGAAYRARSAWVRRHYTPAASVLAGAMLHDADAPFRPAALLLDRSPRQHPESRPNRASESLATDLRHSVVRSRDVRKHRQLPEARSETWTRRSPGARKDASRLRCNEASSAW